MMYKSKAKKLWIKNYMSIFLCNYDNLAFLLWLFFTKYAINICTCTLAPTWHSCVQYCKFWSKAIQPVMFHVKLKLSYLGRDCVCARIFFIPCNKETYFFRNRLNSSNWDISTQFDYIRKIPFQFAIYKRKFFFTIITLVRILKEDNLLFIITMS
jgi:hypothetical protein